MQTFKNTKWLITGGTSGLGLALVEALGQQGAKIAVVARGEANLAQLSERLAEYTDIISIPADVSKKEDIHKIVAQALGQLGGVDYLINNASFLGETPLKSLMDTECETLSEVLKANLLGPFRLSKAILPTMILQKRGTIVNISSDAAVSAYPTWGSYGVSKAALDHLTHIWSEELKEKNIHFLSLDPGDMDTPMHAAALPDCDPNTLKKPAIAAQQLLELLKKEEGTLWLRRSL